MHFPPATAVTTPFESTTATFSSLDFQLTVLSVALVGSTVAVRANEEPASTVFVCGETATAVSGMTTLTSQTSLKPPFTLVQITEAVPTFLPVSVPSEATSTTEVSFDLHVTFLLLAYSGEIFTESFLVSLTPTTALAGMSIPVTSAVTVTVQTLKVPEPSRARALIVVTPG